MKHLYEFFSKLFALLFLAVLFCCHLTDADAQVLSCIGCPEQSGKNLAQYYTLQPGSETIQLAFQPPKGTQVTSLQWQVAYGNDFRRFDIDNWNRPDMNVSAEMLKGIPAVRFRVVYNGSLYSNEVVIRNHLTANENNEEKVLSKSGSETLMVPGPCPNPAGGSLTATAQPAAICQGGSTQLNAVARIPFRLSDNFNGTINNSIWAQTNGTVNNNCTASPVGTQTLWFNGPSNTVRLAETNSFNTTLGNFINFYLKLGGADIPGCEPPDLPNERVFLEYSTDGINWTQIDVYSFSGNFGNWGQECVTIPPGAQSQTTRFRFRQPDNSGVGFDNWAIDNFTLDVEVEPSAINYSWTGGTVSDPFIQNPTASPTSTTTYTVTASFGGVTQTASVTVTVSPPPQGGTTSGAGTACAGSNNRTISLSGHSGSVSFWQESPGCTGVWNTINNTNTSITPFVNTTTCYRAAVVTPGCPPAFSTVTQITVPSIGNVTQDQSLCRGGNIANLNLVGTNCSVVRWERSDNILCRINPNGVSWTPVNNVTTTLNPGALQDTACFRAVVSCSGCPPATTLPVIINVDEPPTPGNITSEGNITRVCSGNAGPLIRLNQFNRTILRWEVSNPCAANNWQPLTPPYENPMPTPAFTAPRTVCYRAVVQNGLCPPENSPPFNISYEVCPQPSPPPVLLQNATVCFNGNFTLQLIPNGWSVGRWEVSLDNGATWSGINHTQLTLNVQNITVTRCYRVFVTNNSNPLSTNVSNVVCLTPTQPITGGIVQGGTVVCSGTNSGCLNLVGNTPPPAGNLLRWETRRWDPSIPGWENGGAWVSVNNITTQICYNNLTRATEWRAVTTDAGNCSTAISFPSRVDVDSLTIPGVVNGATTVCINTNTRLTLTGKTGDVLDWQQQPNCTGNFIPIPATAFITAYTTPNLQQKTCYRVRVKNGVCPEEFSTVAEVDVTPIPNPGVLAPQRTVCRGSSSGIITLTGQTGPITRWERSDNEFGPWITIANTGNTFEQPNIQNTTYYRVIVGSGVCQTISNTVQIVVDPPTIAGLLTVSGGGCVGSNVTLTLTESTGTPVRWEFQDNCAGAWTTVARTTTTFSHLLNVRTCFRVFVQSGTCPGLLTPDLEVTPAPPAVGGIISGTNSVCLGQNGGTLTLSGQVGNILRWERSTNCPGFTGITTIVNTTTQLTLGAMNTTTCYRAVVENPGCPIQNSSLFTITVFPPTVAGTVAAAQTLCPGAAGNALTLTGNTGSVVRWESSTNCPGFTGVTTINNNSATQPLTGLTTTTCYRAVVQNGNCNPANTGIVTVTVAAAPVGGAVTGNQTLCGNQPITPLTLTGHSGGNIVRWERTTDCPNFVNNITTLNVTTANYTPPGPITSTTCFRAVLRSNNNCNAVSQPGTITVAVPTTPGTLASAQTICNGQQAALLTLTGNVGDPVRWESSAGCTNTWTTINHTQTDYAPGSLNTTTCYRVVVSNQGCPSGNSNTVQITVTQNVQPGAVAGGTSICPNQNSGVLTLAGHQGTIVRWESSTDCPNFVQNVNTIVNNQTTYTATGLTTTTCFRAVIQSGNCGLVNSQPTTVTILQTTAGQVNDTQILCQTNNSGILTLTGHNGNIVRWESSPNCVPFVPTVIPNTTDQQTFNGLTQSTCYRAIVQNGNCTPEPSGFALVSLDAPSRAGTIAGRSAVCSGEDPGNLTVTGFNRDILGWQSSVNCPAFGTPTDIPNQTATLPVGAITQTTCFRVIVQNGICLPETSAVFTINVDQPPVPGQVGSATVCRGGTASLTLSGETGTVVRWESALTCNGFNNATPIANITNTLTVPNATASLCYRAMVRNGACPEQPSGTGTITVEVPPAGGTITPPQTICAGRAPTELTLSGQSGTIDAWQFSEDCNGFLNPQTVQGNNTTTYTPPALLRTTCFRVRMTNGTCTSVFSDVVTVSVDELSLAGTLTPDRTICSGNSSELLTLTQGRGNVVRWERSTDCAGNNFGSPININNTNLTYTEQTVTQTTCFRAVVKNGACDEVFSNKVTITVDPSTSAGAVGDDQNICFNTAPAPLTLRNFIGTIVEWQSSTDCGGNTFNNPVTINNLTDTFTPPVLQTSTCYRAVVRSGNCTPAPSSPARINVAPEAVGGTVAPDGEVCINTAPGQLTLSNQVGNVIRWETATVCNPFTPQNTLQVTTTTLQPQPINVTTCYRAIVRSGDGCPEVPSGSATFTVQQLSLGGTVTADRTLCETNTGATFTLTAGTERGDILRWEFSEDCQAFTAPVNLQNAGGRTLTVPVVFRSGCYRAVVQNGTCVPEPSTSARVTLLPPPVAGTLSQNQNLCAGNPVQQLTLQGASQRVGETIEWQEADNVNFTPFNPLNNNNNTTFTPVITTNRFYRVRVTNGVCDPVFSNPVEIRFDAQTVAGTLAQSATLCAESNNGTLTLSGFTGNILRWESATNCTDPQNPVGLQTVVNITSTQTYNNLQQTICYRAVVQSGNCLPRESNFVTLSVDPPTVRGSVAPDRTVCFGATSGVLTLTGHTGTILRWESAIDMNFTQDLQNLPFTTNTLEIVSNTQTRYYRAVVKSGSCPQRESLPALITVRPSPNPGQVTAPQTICTGTVPAELRLENSSQGAAILRWQSSTADFAQGQPVTDIVNTGLTFTPPALTVRTCYRAVVASAQGCDEIFSQIACISIDPQTVPGTIDRSQTLCSNNASGSLTLTGNTGTILGWESASNINFTGAVQIPASSGQTSVNFTALTTTTFFRARVKSGQCPEQIAGPVTVQVDADPAQPEVNPARTICADNFALTATPIAPAVATGQWTVVSGTGTFDNATSPNTTVRNVGFGTNVYRWTVRNGVCDPKFDETAITRDREPTPSNAGINETICQTRTVYTLRANNGIVPSIGTGVWTKTGAGTGTITSPGQPVSDVTGLSIGANEFTYTITNGAVCAPSVSRVVITVVESTLAGVLSENAIVCFGSHNGTLRITGSRGQILRWESAEVSGNGVFTSINNTTTSLTYTNLTRSTRFRAVVQNAPCLPETTNVVTITVDPATVGGAVNRDVSVCSGTNSGALRLENNVGAILRWESSDNPAFNPKTDIENLTPIQPFTNLTATRYYRAIVKSGVCGELPSTAATVDVRVPVVSLAVTNIRCFGELNGSVTATPSGGFPIAGGQPYTFRWERDGSLISTTQNITGLGTGRYCLTVTDAVGCTAVACTSVAEPQLLRVDFENFTNLSCNGINDGTASVRVTGGITDRPYTFNWTRNGTPIAGNSAQLTGLSAGVYTVTVTDFNGCVASLNGNITLTEPSAIISITSYVKPVSCFGGRNGAIGHFVTGGNPPYLFLWTHGATTEDTDNLIAGVYTTTITDASGCRLIKTFDVTQPPRLEIRNVQIQNPPCFGESTGSIRLDVQGGTAPFFYLWSSGQRDEDIYNAPAGVYTLFVRDANGCTVTGGEYTVGQPSPMRAEFEVVRPITCGGGSDGTVRVRISGGTAPYTYLWNTGSTTDQSVNIPAGSYSVAVRDAGGCVQTFVYTLTEPLPLAIVRTEITPVQCKGTATGAIVLTVSGGDESYTYRWSDNAQVQDRQGLIAGLYTLTVTDGKGCRVVHSFTVPEPEAPLRAELLSSKILTCNNGNDGSIDVGITGGWFPYTLKWSDGPTTEDRNNLSSGIYVLEITDKEGCKIIFGHTIENPNLLTVTPNFIKNPTCGGVNNGSIGLQVAGGVPPYRYAWSSGQTTEDLENIPAGNYTLTVTDQISCSLVYNQILTAPAALAISGKSFKSVSCFGVSDGEISVNVSGGILPYSYSWSDGSENPILQNAPAGNHTLTVRDANQCTATATFTVTGPPQIIIRTLIKKDLTCFESADGTLMGQAFGGVPPYTYVWKRGATVISPMMSAFGLSAGTYTLEVTDRNGCTASLNETLTQPSLISVSLQVTNVTCFGARTGEINAIPSGGMAPYSYVWNTGAVGSRLESASAGVYSVTVTDAKGCRSVSGAEITQGSRLGISQIERTNVTCKAASDGRIKVLAVGGKGNFTYKWNTGQNTDLITDLQPGIYSVTATDEVGCTVVLQNISITEPAQPLSVKLSYKRDSRCFEAPSGEIAVDVRGGVIPYQFAWSDGVTTEDRARINGGTYTLTATDAVGCRIIFTETIGGPSSGITVITERVKPVTCNGESNGSVSVNVTGGTQPYTYLWNNGQTTEDIVNLPAANYLILIRDANGCVKNAAFEVTQAPAIAVEAAEIIPSGCLGTGSIRLNISGGIEPYNYQWSNGSTERNLTGLKAGSYQLILTDNLGCVSVSSFNVPSLAGLTGSIQIVKLPTCAGSTDGVLDLTLNGGTPPYTFLWNNGKTTEDITDAFAGNNGVVIMDASGCVLQLSVNIPEILALKVEASSVIHPRCAGINDGMIGINVIGGQRPYLYRWSNGSTAEDLSDLPSGNYVLTVTDVRGCVVSFLQNLTAPSALEWGEPVLTQPGCNGEASGFISLNVSGGTGPYRYRWSTGLQAPTLSNVKAGTYSVTVSDAGGCNLVRSFTLTEPSAIMLSIINVRPANCNGGTNGRADISSSGGTGRLTYFWSNGRIVEDLEGVPSGTYQLIARDENGCSAEISVTIPSAATFTPQIIVSSGNICLNSSVVTLTATPAGGTFSGPGVVGNRFDPSLAGVGRHTITYSGILSGCTYTGTRILEVKALPAEVQIRFAGKPTGDMMFCRTDSRDYQIIVSPVQSGVSPGVSGRGVRRNGSVFVFRPSDAGAGVHLLVLTLTDRTSGCSTSQTVEIQVTSPAIVTVSSGSPSICSGGMTTLTASGAERYSWSPSVGLNTNAGSSVEARPTTTTIYTVTGFSGGCSTTASVRIMVVPQSPVTLTPNTVSNVCAGTPVQIRASGSGYMNYTWNPSPNATNTDGSLVTVMPQNTTVYTVTADNGAGCSRTATILVSVQSPGFTVTGTQEQICAGGATSLTVRGTTEGTYTWSPSEGLNSVTGMTVTANPTRTITYTVIRTDGSGNCNSQVFTLRVRGAVNASITNLNENYCVSSSSFALTGLPAGGNFKVNGVSSVNFDPTLLGTGTHIVEYEGVSGDCSYRVVKNVTVSLRSQAQIIGLQPLHCVIAAPTTFTLQPQGGTLTGEGINGNRFIPSEAGVGMHVIRYFGREANGCEYDMTMNVEVRTSEVTFNLPQNVCIASTAINLTALPVGGTFIGNGVSNGSFDPSVAGTGTHTITYFGVDGPCTYSKTLAVRVVSALQVTSTVANATCSGCTDGSITVNVSGGIAPYTYRLGNGNPQAGNIFGGLRSGNYVINVTDVSGCNLSLTVTVGSGGTQNGCGAINDLILSNIGRNSVTANWTAVPGATGYVLSWRPTGGNLPWTTTNTTGTNFRLTNLTSGTTYEIRVRVRCVNMLSEAVINTFRTLTARTEESSLTETNLSVYPNPNKGAFYLHINEEPVSDLSVQLTDLQGKVVATARSEADGRVLMPENVSSGVYLLIFPSELKMVPVKLVID